MSDSKKNAGEMLSPQLIQQMALLNWLRSDSPESKAALTVVTGVQVAREIYDKLTGQSQVDTYKRECILGIADFVKRNPRASPQEVNAEVEKHVLLFAARVQALDSAPIL